MSPCLEKIANLSGTTCIISMDMLPFQKMSAWQKSHNRIWGEIKWDFIRPYTMPTSIALTKLNPAVSFIQKVDALITAQYASEPVSVTRFPFNFPIIVLELCSRTHSSTDCQADLPTHNPYSKCELPVISHVSPPLAIYCLHCKYCWGPVKKAQLGANSLL